MDKHSKLWSVQSNVLKAVESAKYLWVILSKDLSWNPHAENTVTVAKASKTLEFQGEFCTTPLTKSEKVHTMLSSYCPQVCSASWGLITCRRHKNL